MNLRLKSFLIVGAIFLLLIFILYIFSSLIIRNRFDLLEESDMRRDVSRVTKAIDREVEFLSSLTNDYASWDDTYKFIIDNNKQYIEDNMMDLTLIDLHVNLFLFLNNSGKLIYGKEIDLENKKEIPVSPVLLKLLDPKGPLLTHPNFNPKTGIILLPEGPLVFASRAILTSYNKGPKRGTLVIGHILSSARIEKMEASTNLSFKISRLVEDPLPIELSRGGEGNQEVMAVLISRESDNKISGATVIKDFYGKPILALRVNSNRQLYAQSQSVQSYFFLMIISVCMTFAVFTIVLLEMTGLSRVKQKKAEKGLRESQQMLQTVFDSTPVGIQVKDREGKYLLVNNALASMYGYSPKAMYGLTFRQLGIGTEDQILQIEEDDKKIIDLKKQIEEREEALTLFDGRTIWRNKVKTPLYAESGEVIGMVGVTEDITEYRQAAMELELAKDRLRQSQKMEAIGTLAGGISHNFNNLLQIISGSLSIIETGIDEDHPNYKFITIIHKSIERGSNLTSQLLGFARSGKNEIKNIDINEIIKKMSSMVFESHKNIEIIYDLNKKPWNVYGDKNQIEQAIMNMLINAWQAMPNGGNITLKTENKILDDNFTDLHNAAAGRYVKLSIADTGIGIDCEMIDKIFEPFFTTKEMSHNSGLGLASSYGIIENHRGFIKVDSEVGKGTAFNVYLPANGDRKKMEMTEPPVEEKIFGTGTILFVDDEEEIISVSRQILEDHGFKVIVAKTGFDAIKIYNEQKEGIDLVILDMILPLMGGGEVYDKMKILNPDLKALLSSGYSIDGEADQILKRGCNGFIQKPFNINDLVKKIHEILQ